MPTPRLALHVRPRPLRGAPALLLAGLVAVAAPYVAPLAPDVAEAAGSVRPRPPAPRPYAAKPTSRTRGGTERLVQDPPTLFSNADPAQLSESKRRKAWRDFVKALAKAEEPDGPKKAGPEGEPHDPPENCSRPDASPSPACPPDWVREGGIRFMLDRPAGFSISDAISDAVEVERE